MLTAKRRKIILIGLNAIMGTVLIAQSFANSTTSFTVLDDQESELTIQSSDASSGSFIEFRAIDTGIDHVIHVSIDGLHADFVTEELMPVLSELMANGASTLNARTDPDFTNTLPNHTSQFTGRPVSGSLGHQVDFNTDNGSYIHAEAGQYVQSVFDVVHDNGGETALLAGKSKFNVIERSYIDEGGPDTTDEDDGTSKIDFYTASNPEDKLNEIISRLEDPATQAYAFYHIRTPDSSGHTYDWGSSEYEDSVEEADALLAELLQALDDADLRETTALIITADHGGTIGESGHSDKDNPDNFTIPFIVSGPNVSTGDLYELNPTTRQDPANTQLPLGTTQPVRSGDAGNLALDMLGLPPIPGSVFNNKLDLNY